MQRIEFRLMLSSCVCVCVCVCVCLCVCMPRLCTPGKRFEIEMSFFFKLRGIKPDIICKSLTQIGVQIQNGGQNGGRETLWLAVTEPFINIDTSRFLLIVRNDTAHQL